MKILVACMAVILLAGCASDGGIIGSGNRIDCEDRANVDKDECKGPGKR